ncbi:MAG: LCP family protein [Acidimicrobiia bacterium]
MAKPTDDQPDEASGAEEAPLVEAEAADDAPPADNSLSRTWIPDRWRGVAAAALSLIVPGSGHLFLRKWRRAAPFLAGSLVVLLTAFYFYGRGTIGLLGLLVQPKWVWGLVIANLVIAALRVVAAVDAYRLAPAFETRSQNWAVLVRGGIATVLVLFLVVPHVFVGERASALLTLLDRVFVDDAQAAAAEIRVRVAADAARFGGSVSATTTTVPPSTTTTLPRGTIPTGGVEFGELPDPTLSPTANTRVTVLLAGGDAGPGRTGLRTDVMMLASLDLATNQASIISISRETVGWLLPTSLQGEYQSKQDYLFNLAKLAEENGSTQATDPEPEERPRQIWLDRINAVYPSSTSFTNRYPNGVSPGMEALIDVIEATLAIPIDYYVLVDFAGFVDVIDAIGGVTVTVRSSMNVLFSPAKPGDEEFMLELSPGRQRMDGRTALAYARNRSDSNDIVRTRRQRCLIREVAAQADAYRILREFPRLATTIERHVTTNIPLRVLPDLITLVAALDTDDITTGAIEQGNLAPKRNYRFLPVIDPDRARAYIRQVFAGLETGSSPLSTEECG